MEASKIARVIVSGITSTAEADLAIRCGADALGVACGGPGGIAEETILKINQQIPPPICAFLMTRSTKIEELAGQQRRCRANALQLLEMPPTGIYTDLRRLLSGIELIQTAHIGSEVSIRKAFESARQVSALILAPEDPRQIGTAAETSAFWKLCSAIREQSPAPVFVSGPRTAKAVAEVIKVAGPFGIELNAAVRTDGALDEGKLKRCISAAR
jgi:phosphoribosylanthranilate isomerase